MKWGKWGWGRFLRDWKEVYMMGNGVGVNFMSEKGWISCMRGMD